MRFDLRRPCKNCPFRTNITPFLSAARMAQILDDLLRRDMTFTCHKTISGQVEEECQVDEEWDDNYRPYVPGPKDQHCAGALILLAHAGNPNFKPRLAQMIGIFDPTRLDMTAPVYQSEKEAMDAHST